MAGHSRYTRQKEFEDSSFPSILAVPRKSHFFGNSICTDSIACLNLGPITVVTITSCFCEVSSPLSSFAFVFLGSGDPLTWHGIVARDETATWSAVSHLTSSLCYSSGMKFLTKRIERQKIKGNGIRAAGNPDEEPSFSKYPICAARTFNNTSQNTREIAKAVSPVVTMDAHKRSAYE